MGHRLTRNTPTKARRIHATDDEWEKLRTRAEASGVSMSAFIVQTALHPRTAPRHHISLDAIPLLAAVDARLAALAETIEQTWSPIEAVSVLLEMERIAERIDGMASLLNTGMARCC